MKIFIWLFVLGIAFSSTPAHAGKLMEFFFPSLKTQEPDPRETLQAPFAYNPDTALSTEEKIDHLSKGLPQNAAPLHKRHRAAGDISAWIEQTLPQALTLKKADLQTPSAWMSANGTKEYQKFLAQTGIEKALNSGQYDLHGIVAKTPVLLNEGPVQGRYRWLYKVPVLLTYLESHASNYKGIKKPKTYHMDLKIQVGRANDGAPPHGLFVEHWSVQPPEKKK